MMGRRSETIIRTTEDGVNLELEPCTVCGPYQTSLSLPKERFADHDR